MKLKLYHVPAAKFDGVAVVWRRILAEMGKRNACLADTEAVLREIRRVLTGYPGESDAYLVWDDDRKDVSLDNYVAAVVLVVYTDADGQPVCNVWLGWIQKGYKCRPWLAFQGELERWARARRCVGIEISTTRTAGEFGHKHYVRWAARAGYRPYSQTCRKDLVKAGSGKLKAGEGKE